MLMNQRKLRIGVQVRNDLRVYEATPDSQVGIIVSGLKTADSTKNKFSVQLTNIDAETRAYLLEATSPFNAQRVPHLLLVDAGTISGEYSSIFRGHIVATSVTQPPDVTLVLEAKTSAYDALDVNVIAYSQPLTLLSVIAMDIAASMDLRLVFEANDQQIKNWNHSGPKPQQVDKLNKLLGVDAFIDDDLLIVKNTGFPIQGSTTTISQNSVMIGQPQGTDKGCSVNITFDPSVRIGASFTLDSVTNQSLDGDYEIFELNYQLSSRNTDFSIGINAKRVGINNKRLVSTESAERDTERLVAQSGGTSGLLRTLVPTSSPSATTNPTSSMRSVIERSKAGMATQVPAMVIEYDRGRNVAMVQGMLMVRTSDGGSVPMATIAEVPVLGLGCADTLITFPLTRGSLGWIEASSGDISSFMDTLGPSPVPTSRVHDWADSRFIPDAFRQYTLPDEAEGALCIQSGDGSTYIALSKGKVSITSSDEVTLNASTVTINADTLNFNGTVSNINSNMNVSGTLSIDGKVFNNHYHLYDGDKKTSDPQNA